MLDGWQEIEFTNFYLSTRTQDNKQNRSKLIPFHREKDKFGAGKVVFVSFIVPISVLE